MLIYSFAPVTGRSIERFGSRGVKFSPILRGADQPHIACIHLEANGIIGRHEAPSDQLLLVVQGSGLVTGAESQAVRVESCCAVFWRQGEMHETRAQEKGLTAIVIEGGRLDPAEVMRLSE